MRYKIIIIKRGERTAHNQCNSHHFTYVSYHITSMYAKMTAALENISMISFVLNISGDCILNINTIPFQFVNLQQTLFHERKTCT